MSIFADFIQNGQLSDLNIFRDFEKPDSPTRQNIEKLSCQNSDKSTLQNIDKVDTTYTTEPDETISERSEKALEIIDDLKKHVPERTPRIP